jgi:hypothetical protein
MILDPGATRTRMRARAYPGEDPQSVKDPEIVARRIAELAAAGFEDGRFERIAAPSDLSMLDQPSDS